MARAGGCASARCPTRDAADALRGAYLEIGRPAGRGPRPAARTTGTRSSAAPVRGIDGDRARHRPGHLPGRRDRGLRGRRRRRTATSTCRPSARSSGSSRRAAARSWSTPTSLDLRRPSRDAGSRPPEGAATPDRLGAADRAADARPAAGDAAAERTRPGRPATPDPGRPRTRRGMTLEIDVLTLFPAMFEGPLAESIPGRIQEQGLAERPGPRPARLGHRAAPLGRRPRRTAGERG